MPMLGWNFSEEGVNNNAFERKPCSGPASRAPRGAHEPDGQGEDAPCEATRPGKHGQLFRCTSESTSDFKGHGVDQAKPKFRRFFKSDAVSASYAKSLYFERFSIWHGLIGSYLRQTAFIESETTQLLTPPRNYQVRDKQKSCLALFLVPFCSSRYVLRKLQPRRMCISRMGRLQTSQLCIL